MKQYQTKGKEILGAFIEGRQGKRFCAGDVLSYLQEQGDTLNQATVYRRLEKMTEQGLLMKTKNVADGCCYYQYASPDHHCEKHLHLQCKRCGKIIHLEGAYMKPFYQYVEEELGFLLQHKESVILGLCAECR